MYYQSECCSGCIEDKRCMLQMHNNVEKCDFMKYYYTEEDKRSLRNRDETGRFYFAGFWTKYLNNY